LLEYDRKDYKNAGAYYQRAVEVQGGTKDEEAEALTEASILKSHLHSEFCIVNILVLYWGSDF
jgi:hypothetical protein